MQSFRAADGARLTFRDQGTGVPVLALAGLTRDGRDFDYLARHLSGVRLLRLDCRGRGGSDWTGPETYSVGQEAHDALALLDHLGLERVALIGASRGGLLAMVMAALARPRLLGLCLNDVGPVVERAGLERIGRYLGVAPDAASLDEMAARLPAANPGFRHVPARRWREEAARHYTETPDGLGLPYDPALKQAFRTAMEAPAADLWPLFDACAGLPMAVIRGENSDVLSAATAARMGGRHPGLIHAEVRDRGHMPFLDEPEALEGIARWLGLIHAAADEFAQNSR